MTRPKTQDVQRVACIGAGVIGGGWAAHFLGRGYDVALHDPGPGYRDKFERLLDAAWPVMEALGLADGADRARLRHAGSIEDALEGAEFVQESAPERLELKQDLLARLDAAAAPEIVVSSSTSGFLMTDMAKTAPDGRRLVVGHPFNPPYLIPLVEVVGGERSDPEAVAWTGDFYEAAGKSVIRMDRELPGFIANRLQEAVWREVLYMVDQGEATIEQIDRSITEGPGLRWAIFGPALTYHLAGGEGGMAHNLDHFGPALEEPWCRMEAPELTPALRDRVIAEVDDEAAGRTVADLVAQRDAGLVAILKALREANLRR